MYIKVLKPNYPYDKMPTRTQEDNQMLYLIAVQSSAASGYLVANDKLMLSLIGNVYLQVAWHSAGST